VESEISPMRAVCLLLLSTLMACAGAGPPDAGAPAAADLLLLDGYVYTVDARRSVAQAVAVRDGEIVFVGASAGAQRFLGANTRVVDLDGRMLLPGLHDVHIHLLSIVSADVCDLADQPVSLEEMVTLLRGCLARYAIAQGEWLTVQQWAFSTGNQPSERYPTLRAALDGVSASHPILLWGNDGHHAAANSAALARARDDEGRIVGLDAATLATLFRDYRALVGVDAAGEPDGALNEDARFLVDPPSRRPASLASEVMPGIGPKLARYGITSVQDAALPPEALPAFAASEAAGEMTFRLQAAMYLDPHDHRATRKGPADLDAMIAKLAGWRARYRDSALIDATAAKIFVDGVLEGNPRATPPTLPNGAMLREIKQPRFRFDPDTGDVRLQGYVDTASPLCVDARARHFDVTATGAFERQHGFHPDQCVISNGVLEDGAEFVEAYTAALAAAGFIVHSHAIGDRAVRVALDAFEHAREKNGVSGLPHAIAHAQVVHPDDVARIGALGLHVAFTYAWITAEQEYDLMVIPFVDEIGGEGLYDAGGYYMQNVYPAASIARAGGVLVAGSDAPVESREPRPYVNMQQALTRAGPAGILNADERIDVHQIIAAYTINGAGAMQQADRVGSIEVGKRADLAVLDRNLVELHEAGRTDEIGGTRVMLTIFDGKVVHEAPRRDE